ncbi:MAG: ABC transporter permease [Roseomonas sp.]|nr:ABC transporter permease [Roseomonas sp.]
MLTLLLRRLLLGLVTIWLVSGLIFLAVEALPGDACTAYLQRDAVGQRLAHCQAELGLDRPAVLRYLEWIGGALRGDFGFSVNGSRRIAAIVGDRLRNTLLLAGCTILLGVPLALMLGVITALRRDKATDILLSAFAIFAMTIPEFVSATLLIFIFSIWLGWLPGIVMASSNAPLGAFFPEIILPVLVLMMVMSAHILRTVRSSVIDVMASDYVRMAELKGVPHRRVILCHALPNALLPAINIVALTMAWLLGGVVVVETVFNYPGLGRLMVDAIAERDLHVVQAIALILAAVYVGLNLIADLLTHLLNPRLRGMKLGS